MQALRIASFHAWRPLPRLPCIVASLSLGFTRFHLVHRFFTFTNCTVKQTHVWLSAILDSDVCSDDSGGVSFFLWHHECDQRNAANKRKARNSTDRSQDESTKDCKVSHGPLLSPRYTTRLLSQYVISFIFPASRLIF